MADQRCAERIGYITNFCSMIELLQELNISSCQHRSIQAFDNVSTRKKENYCKSLLKLLHTMQENKGFLAYFMRILNSCKV